MKNAKKTLIESDKAMGDVYINSIELHDAALDILNGPNFERTATPESDISKNVFLNTMQIWKNYKKAIYPHIKKDGIYYKWYSNMKKIEKDKKWLKVPNLCPMIKLHKEEIHWMRVINAEKWYSSIFSKFLQIQLDLMIAALMVKSDTFIILQNSYNLINDINKLNNSKTSFD